MKKICLSIMMMLLLVGCANESAQAPTGDTKLVKMEIENYGDVTIELYEDVAPKTVENFLNLVEEGFYDGLTFHRIIDGFMVQGGDPEGTGFGGAENTIVGEFSNNGFQNVLKHEEGVISMARSNDPNSASSQFFIMVASAPHLDGNYAAFGKVIEGMDLIHQIAKDANPVDNNGTILPEEQPVMKSIKIVE